MLTADAFARWCIDVGLSTEARSTVAAIRGSRPSRRVNNRHRNVIGRFPSQKMGVTIQFESHTVELATIFELEHDSRVLEYYDQPPRLKLVYQSIHGRGVSVWHTPDFFVLRQGSAGWEECKPAARLEQLADKSPGRYVLVEGVWRCPPGEAVAHELGLYYRFRSSADIDWVFQRNLRFLSDYLVDERLVVDGSARNEILSIVPETGFVTLANLIATIQIAKADDVFGLIAQRQLFVELSAAALAEPARVRVFRDLAASQDLSALSVTRPCDEGFEYTVGTPIEWDGRMWSVANVGEQSIALVSATRHLVEITRQSFNTLVLARAIVAVPSRDGTRDPAQDLLDKAHPDDLAEALDRLRLIERYRNGDQPVSPARRTLQAWATRFNRAERAFGVGIVGLLPHRRGRGNHAPRLAAETRELMIEFIRTRYETPRHVAKKRVYEALVLECDQRNLQPPSFKTVCRHIRARAGVEQLRARSGKRAAYSTEPFIFTLEAATPRHGDRPFEIVHIDHTELDIELVDSETGKNLGRPWATFVSDAFSRRLLAVVCLYDPPSYRTCLVALRLLVRRHNRFPDTVVVDNGKEFDSVYFETLLARFHAIKKSRPPGAPRFGSVCERLFGTSNSELIHTLQGNTQIARAPRAATGKLAPKRQAVWTLPELDRVVSEWAYDVYDTREHPALAASPRRTFDTALARSGARASRLVPYDEAFRMLTLPSTPKGTARVVAGRGILVRAVYYWAINDAFRSPHVEGTDVPVRYDPFDVGVAYAYVDAHWVRCISEHYVELRDRSEREVQLASLELRKRREVPIRQQREAVRQLASFLGSATATEAIQLQRLRDREARSVLSSEVVGGAATPEAAARESGSRARPTPKRKPRASQVKDALGPLTEYGRY